MAISYTIGGMMLFPRNRIEGKWTLNQARGCLRKISDRFDLTLECIRQHYESQSSPLGETLARYRDFFALFKSFSGYVDFFLLSWFQLAKMHVVPNGRVVWHRAIQIFFMNMPPRLPTFFAVLERAGERLRT